MYYKAGKRFSIIFFVTKQSGISFNAARVSSAASSHSLWVLYLSEQCIIKKGSSQTTLSQISWVYMDQSRMKYKKHL